MRQLDSVVTGLAGVLPADWEPDRDVRVLRWVGHRPVRLRVQLTPRSPLNDPSWRRSLADAALQGVAVTAIRDLVAEVPAADVVFRRRQLEADVLPRLQNVPERWGGIITSVEIRDITAREC